MSAMKHMFLQRVVDSPSFYSTYSECQVDTMASVDLSSVMYSPDIVIHHNSPVTQSPDIRSVSIERPSHRNDSSTGVTTARNLSVISRPFADRSINNKQSCIRVLDFTEYDMDSERGDACSIHEFNDLRQSLASYSSGYSSSSSCQSRISKVGFPPAPPCSPCMSDSAIYDVDALGERPDCIGQESSPSHEHQIPHRQCVHHISRHKLANTSRMSMASDTSAFMHAPLCQAGVTKAKSIASNKTIKRRMKQFSKHFHRIMKSTDHSLKTLAVV